MVVIAVTPMFLKKLSPEYVLSFLPIKQKTSLFVSKNLSIIRKRLRTFLALKITSTRDKAAQMRSVEKVWLEMFLFQKCSEIIKSFEGSKPCSDKNWQLGLKIPEEETKITFPP